MTDYFVTEEFIGQEHLKKKKRIKKLLKGTGAVSRHLRLTGPRFWTKGNSSKCI